MTGQFLTWTGDHIEGTAEEITEQQGALDWLRDRYFGEMQDVLDTEEEIEEELCATVQDDWLIDLALNAQGGEDFQSLWEGDWSNFPS